MAAVTSSLAEAWRAKPFVRPHEGKWSGRVTLASRERLQADYSARDPATLAGSELESAALLSQERWFYGRPFGPQQFSYKYDQAPQRPLQLETAAGHAHRFRGTVSPPNCAVPRCTALDGFVH